jgi:hypothetical protein
MKRLIRPLVPLAFCATILAAHAHGDGNCPAIPKAEWKPQAELTKKLTADGWKIRRVKETAKCYEVYATDPQGKRVEAFFNPKTFERVEKN